MNHNTQAPASKAQQSPKDRWDKAEIFGKGVFAVSGIIIAVCFDHTIKVREVNVKLVEVAVGVLKNKPDPEMEGLREWSIEVVKRYSGVPLSKKAEEELRHKALPDYLSTEKGNVITDEKGNPIVP